MVKSVKRVKSATLSFPFFLQLLTVAAVFLFLLVYRNGNEQLMTVKREERHPDDCSELISFFTASWLKEMKVKTREGWKKFKAKWCKKTVHSRFFFLFTLFSIDQKSEAKKGMEKINKKKYFLTDSSSIQEHWNELRILLNYSSLKYF